jgi:methionyl aminopeptidase
MSVIVKTQEQIDLIRESCHRLATVLHKVKEMVAPGVSTYELDQYAQKLIREYGDTPAFLNYRPEGARKPFPASLCVSINDEVVHGIPRKDRILKEGDIISIDLGLNHKGFFSDMAMTVPVGAVDDAAMKLLAVCEEALHVGIDACRAGNKTGDVGYAIEKFVHTQKTKYGIVEILSGHGVGVAIHEDPYVPNFGEKGTGVKLVPGMILAIEPMLNMGTKNVFIDKDDWTFKTNDGKRSAHFEHTVLITEEGPEVLTIV